MGLPSIYGLFSSYFSQLHFSKLKIPYFDTSQGHCDPFSVHMPLFVISYLRSVLCPHGCLTCYMLLSVLTAVFAGLISCNLQAVHTHNLAAPTAIFIGLSFRNTQCLSNCKFLITIRSLNSFRFLPALPYLYICNFPANAFPSLLLLLS